MGQALRFFAVDAEDLFEVAGHFLNVAPQFVFVGMAGVGVEGNDPGADVTRVAKDVDGRFGLRDLVAERAFGAVADEQHQLFLIADVVL